jgi:hypothetical protein
VALRLRLSDANPRRASRRGTTAEAETIRYSLDNNTYEIDLSSANAEKLRDFLKDYIEHSRTESVNLYEARLVGIY